MSKILLTLAHPNPQSLNAATANSIKDALEKAGHEVRMNDLYRKDFQALLGFDDFGEWQRGQVPADITPYHEDIDWADGLAFVYPIWWNTTPAILKGYFDRTYTKGFAWDFAESGLVGKLKGKKAFLATTLGSPEALYDGLEIPKEHIHNAVKLGTLKYCGIIDTEVYETFGILTDGPEPPKAHIKGATEAAVAFFG